MIGWRKIMFISKDSRNNIIIDYDLPEAKAIASATLVKLKKLLNIVSTSVPFKPNIAKISPSN